MTTEIMPIDIGDAEYVFPAGALDYMPAYEDIPEDFREGTGEAIPWIEFQRTWFYRGLSHYFSFSPTDGVNAGKAWRQLNSIARSYAPKHEHKEAAIAYLASLWMSDLVYGEADAKREELKTVGDATIEDWSEYLDAIDQDDEIANQDD